MKDFLHRGKCTQRKGSPAMYCMFASCIGRFFIFPGGGRTSCGCISAATRCGFQPKSAASYIRRVLESWHWEGVEAYFSARGGVGWIMQTACGLSSLPLLGAPARKHRRRPHPHHQPPFAPPSQFLPAHAPALYHSDGAGAFPFGHLCPSKRCCPQRLSGCGPDGT